MKRPTRYPSGVLKVVDNPYDRVIWFFATPAALAEIAQYSLWGKPVETIEPDYYRIVVDPRYDFQEVVDFINSYGRGQS